MNYLGNHVSKVGDCIGKVLTTNKQMHSANINIDSTISSSKVLIRENTFEISDTQMGFLSQYAFPSETNQKILGPTLQEMR